MTEIIKHTESLDDLIQVGDSFMQDLQEGINMRIAELLKENNLVSDDIVEICSDISVNITIKYNKVTEWLYSLLGS